MNHINHGSIGKITYNYKFIFKNGVEKEFNIEVKLPAASRGAS
jgi:hypothetical protein